MRLIADDLWAILTVWGEARGESFLGKVGVAEVIRNRMARRFLSDGTVIGTVLKSYQFSCWNTSDPNRLHMARLEDDSPMYHECARAWTESASTIVTQGAVAYLNPRALPQLPAWYDPAAITLREGRHEFLKL